VPMDFINQNILLIGIVVVSGLGLLWPLFVRGGGNRVNTVEATRLINREDALVLDVREPSEFSNGHLPDSRNIPLAKLDERLSEIEKLKDKTWIVCCAAGMRASKACSAMAKQGFTKVHLLDGGVDAWVGAGLPIKKGTRNK
jgi:rhodanese-related sulfurtransferase